MGSQSRSTPVNRAASQNRPTITILKRKPYPTTKPKTMSDLSLFAANIQEIDAQIDSLQYQILGLNEKKKQLLEAENACLQVISYIDVATTIIQEINPDLVATFGQIIATKIAGCVKSTSVVKPETAPESKEIVSKPDSEPVADATSQATPDPSRAVNVAQEKEITTLAPKPTQTATLTEFELNKVSIQRIRRLATIKQVSNGGTRSEIASRLIGLVTQREVDELIARDEAIKNSTFWKNTKKYK